MPQVLLCGPSGCGKSWYVEQHIQPRDVHRFNMWHPSYDDDYMAYCETNYSREHWQSLNVSTSFSSVVYWAPGVRTPTIIRATQTDAWAQWWGLGRKCP